MDNQAFPAATRESLSQAVAVVGEVLHSPCKALTQAVSKASTVAVRVVAAEVVAVVVGRRPSPGAL